MEGEGKVGARPYGDEYTTGSGHTTVSPLRPGGARLARRIPSSSARVFHRRFRLLVQITDSLRRDSRRLAIHCAQFLDRHKLEDISVLHVAPFGVTDYFVLATGRNSRHLKAAGDKLFKELRECGVDRKGVEGYRDEKWVLVDLADAVVHLFSAEGREFYDLELLWGDCPRIEWRSEDSPPPLLSQPAAGES